MEKGQSESDKAECLSNPSPVERKRCGWKMNWIRGIYIGIGFISLLFAAIGAVLPLLPCVPFLMVSVFCFGKGSTKLKNWLMKTKLYQNHFKDFAEKREMSRITKIKVILSVTVMMLLGFVMMKKVPVGQFVLFIIWIFHILYFALGVKTKKNMGMEEAR